MSGSEPGFAPPEELFRIAETLESRGFQAWAVGGAVRDELLGHGRADWDLATDARPEDVLRVFRRTVPVGIEHGTVGVLSPSGTLYEVTTFRRDVETDGRHAVITFADTIEEDLARRDFTINALAWRPATDELRDPFGGREDLDRRVLRAVGEPAERFAEDYLRVLRGIRFAGRLALEIEERTREALFEAAARLGRLSAERIREELMKVLADRTPSAALRLYREVGALEVWYPELVPAARREGAWELNLGAVDALPAARPLVRLARWLVPVGDGGETAGAGAEERAVRGMADLLQGEEGVEGETREAGGRELMERLRFSNAETRRVAHLLRHYRPLVSPVDGSAEIRQWLAEVGSEAARDLFRLHFADARAAGATEKARYLVAAWRRVHAELLDAPPLRLADLAVDGNDLLALGVRQGPYVGILLDELHAEVLEDPERNEREWLLGRARELMELGALGERGEPRGGSEGPHEERAGSPEERGG